MDDKNQKKSQEKKFQYKTVERYRCADIAEARGKEHELLYGEGGEGPIPYFDVGRSLIKMAQPLKVTELCRRMNEGEVRIRVRNRKAAGFFEVLIKERKEV